MFSKPQSLKVVKYILANGMGGFTQNGTSEGTVVSVSLVNDIVHKLKQKFIVSNTKPLPFKLTEPRRLLLTLAAESSMAERLYASYELPGKKEDIEAKLSHQFNDKTGYAFTLLSALPHYANHVAQGNQVSLYVNKKKIEQADKIIRKLGGGNSSIGNVQVFTANEGTLWDRVKTKTGYIVSLEQLLIDLYASPSLLYIGQELLASKEK